MKFCRRQIEQTLAVVESWCVTVVTKTIGWEMAGAVTTSELAIVLPLSAVEVRS